MNIKQIVAGIYYAGVNDRVTSLFEGLWPIPKGVSYNSYIVAGSEKTALIDTVRIDTVRDFFNNIKGLIGDRKIDYLVVNHMEPDHSGSIPEIVRAYPELKIIGNAQTVGMIKGFYHIDDPDRFLTIKDGEEVSLGDMTLRFYLTPMVHWPETMMTYVPERKTLFSGDAFGCFGALSGAVVDTEMTTDLYFPEMHRYYANIVGKYGMHVQRALKKLAGVEFDYICSTHGTTVSPKSWPSTTACRNMNRKRESPSSTDRCMATRPRRPRRLPAALPRPECAISASTTLLTAR